jgi:cyclic-di-GMP-binding protein
MPISLKLPNLDHNPILLAETRAHKINEFIQNLPFGDPIRAATDLIEELQIINSQKVAFTNRLNALELYRPAAIQIYQDLIPHFSNASLPISKNEQAFASAAEQLWQEFAFGYKFALVDLQNKILNLNSSKTTALVIQRAIHACKEIALIHHLTYASTPIILWGELHQLYYCALQQSAENLPVAEHYTSANASSVNLIYTQILLLNLANPQHFANQDIVKIDSYLGNVAHQAELRPLGFIENPTGVFLVALNGNKPPTAFVKNKTIPDGSTDILLVTLNLARQIHQHIKLLREGIVPNDGSMPKNAIETHFADLLAHLIKQYGKTPQRVFSRSKKSDGVELGIGINSTHHLIREVASHFSPHQSISGLGTNGIYRPSRWQILNVSAGGYALRKFNSSQATAQIGDVVAMKDNSTKLWELAVLRWAKVNELKQLDVGLQLISPSAAAVSVRADDNALENEALLLPELAALKQPASIITAVGLCKIGSTLELHHNNAVSNLQITQLVERTASFERFQYSLI